jgi:hypothetical protein
MVGWVSSPTVMGPSGSVASVSPGVMRVSDPVWHMTRGTTGRQIRTEVRKKRREILIKARSALSLSGRGVMVTPSL